MDSDEMSMCSDSEEEAIASVIDNEFDEGRLAFERMVSGAVYISDEPYFYTGPRSLLVGRHDQHAVRMGPQTRECDNASRAGTSHGAIGQGLNVAGQRRDEFHKTTNIC